MLLSSALVVAWVVLLVAWITALVHASRHSSLAFREAGRSRGGTIALIVLSGWLGAIYYWLVIKREIAPHRDSFPKAPRSYPIDPSSYA